MTYFDRNRWYHVTALSSLVPCHTCRCIQTWTWFLNPVLSSLWFRFGVQGDSLDYNVTTCYKHVTNMLQHPQLAPSESEPAHTGLCKASSRAMRMSVRPHLERNPVWPHPRCQELTLTNLTLFRLILSWAALFASAARKHCAFLG